MDEEAIITAEDRLVAQLFDFGYDGIALASMSPAEQNRLLALHQHFEDYEYDLGWYRGTGPCYDMLHDYLTGCSFNEAITLIGQLYPAVQPK